MTEKQALTKIRKHVKDHGGNPKYIEARRTECWPWKYPKGVVPPGKRTCSFPDHPLDCPTGIPLCQVQCFRPVPENQLGLPGFMEVIAEAESWAEVVEITLKRKFWC